MSKQVKQLNLIITILFFLLVCSVFAQVETKCGDGLDNDGDGFVDCFDSDCKGDSSCNEFYYGAFQTDTACDEVPFTIDILWSTDTVFGSKNIPVVGDIDMDGIPEVLSFSSYNFLNTANQGLYIVDGTDGTTQQFMPAISYPTAMWDQNPGVTIGDVNYDGYAEIFLVRGNSTLESLTYDTVLQQWGAQYTAIDPVGYLVWDGAGFSYNGYRWTPGLADFNGDGVTEVYLGNQIFSSYGLVKITEGGLGNSTGQIVRRYAPSGDSLSESALPVAADVLPDNFCPSCDGLELVCGNTVYALDFSDPFTCVMTIAAQAPAGLYDGYTSVADFNNDGQLDVIVNSGNPTDMNTGNEGRIYVWDPRTQTQIGNTYFVGQSVNYPNTTNRGGRPSVADFDGDGELEIAVGGASILILIDNDMTELWGHITKDLSSDQTTASGFDFNGDGPVEVAYRDEDSLFIFDGATGTTLAKFPCGSGTWLDYPVIADVNGDGHANIVCLCNDYPGGLYPSGHPSSGFAQFGRLVAFKGVNNDWVPTRKVMNQHSYSVVNVNDNLTIPRQQQNTALIPELNAFLNQTLIMDENGDPLKQKIGNAYSIINDVVFDSCEFNVQILICNDGSKVFDEGMPVSLFDGNPNSGGVLLALDSIINAIAPGFCEIISFPLQPGSYDLYVYANHDGTTPPDPAGGSNFIQPECDYWNNWDSMNVTESILTGPFAKDDTICIDEIETEGGIVIMASGGSSYTWYELGSTSIINVGPAYFFDEDTTTSYVLIVDNKGCQVEDTIIITVLDCDTVLFIPNSISLSTSNNILNAYGDGVGSVEALRIYDRYGEKIYELYNSLAGWDGKDKNGKRVNEGVYVYSIEGTFRKNTSFVRRGNVMVIQ